MNKILRFFVILTILLFSMPKESRSEEPRQIEEKDSPKVDKVESDPAERYFYKVKRDLFLNAYLHRLRLRGGYDYSHVQPFVLEENADSWMINSIYFGASHPEMPLSIPVSSPDYVPMPGNRLALEYSYRNRFHMEIFRSDMGEKMDREDPTTVVFVNPGNSTYYTSAFEGVRLVEYRDTLTMARAEYDHPLLSWMRVGLSVRKDRLLERNTFSFGSYNLTRRDASNPLLLTWSIGGDTKQIFQLNGTSPGVVIRLQPYDWLEFVFRTEYISRKGNFNLSGLQLLEQSQEGVGGSRYFGSTSAFRGDVKEVGTSRRWEAVFHFCRFAVHTGIERVEMKRGYDTYIGNNVSNITGVSFKTNGVGIGELSKDFKYGRTSFFFEPSVSFHF